MALCFIHFFSFPLLTHFTRIFYVYIWFLLCFPREVELRFIIAWFSLFSLHEKQKRNFFFLEGRSCFSFNARFLFRKSLPTISFALCSVLSERMIRGGEAPRFHTKLYSWTVLNEMLSIMAMVNGEQERIELYGRIGLILFFFRNSLSLSAHSSRVSWM